MKICYLISSEDYSILDEIRKYMLVVNCRIKDCLSELCISRDLVSISSIKENMFLEANRVDEDIKKMYNNNPCPGISKIFKTGENEWTTLLKVEA